MVESAVVVVEWQWRWHLVTVAAAVVVPVAVAVAMAVAVAVTVMVGGDGDGADSDGGSGDRITQRTSCCSDGRRVRLLVQRRPLSCGEILLLLEARVIRLARLVFSECFQPFDQRLPLPVRGQSMVGAPLLELLELELRVHLTRDLVHLRD